jgi:hypothetical protein
MRKKNARNGPGALPADQAASTSIARVGAADHADIGAGNAKNGIT